MKGDLWTNIKWKTCMGTLNTRYQGVSQSKWKMKSQTTCVGTSNTTCPSVIQSVQRCDIFQKLHPHLWYSCSFVSETDWGNCWKSQNMCEWGLGVVIWKITRTCPSACAQKYFHNESKWWFTSAEDYLYNQVVKRPALSMGSDTDKIILVT